MTNDNDKLELYQEDFLTEHGNKILNDRKDCPCLNCICIPICKYKKYETMVENCTLLEEYLYVFDHVFFRKPDYSKLINEVIKIVKPRYWDFSEHFGIVIVIYEKQSINYKIDWR